MATLAPVLSCFALVFLSLTADPISCKDLAPDSHVHSPSRREVKGGTTATVGPKTGNDVNDFPSGGGNERNKATDEFREIVALDLTNEELQALMIAEDAKFGAEADEHVGLKGLKDAHRGSKSTTHKPTRHRRVVVPVLRAVFTAGRSFLRSFSRGPTTTSGSRVTQHYSKPGTYQDAVRDFQSFSPSVVKPFSGRISGQTGTLGNHKVTVRDGSKQGSPTLEIRSHGDQLVRKFRYEPPK